MVFSETLRGFLRRLYRGVAEVAWPALGSLVLIHFALSWLGLALAGEPDMRSFVSFLYYYATTATTVGYGDISPSTDAGRMFVVFWLYPGSIALFTATIAKAVSSVSEFWRRSMNGLGDFSRLEGASVIIGYHPHRMKHMIDEIVAGGHDADIVLVSKKIDTNPDPRIHFVRAASLTSEADLIRAGVRHAARVVVYADDDEQTLAAALAASAIARSAHLVAYFQSADTARLLKSHCPGVECVVSISVEQVVRAMQDPGSSIVIDTLVSTTESATIYSLVLPKTLPETPVARVADWLRRIHRANLVAFTAKGDEQPIFHYDDEARMLPGSRFFFVRGHRLAEAEADWSQLSA